MPVPQASVSASTPRSKVRTRTSPAGVTAMKFAFVPRGAKSA